MWADALMFFVSGGVRGNKARRMAGLLGGCPCSDLGRDMASPTMGESGHGNHGNTGFPEEVGLVTAS